MNRSLEMFISFHRSRTPLGPVTMLSTNCWGVPPASLALSSIFWPCSSVPVRNITSQPVRRLYRAMASVATVQ